jgi:6-pyruvoyl-tetrahydropterin synthase
MSLPIQPARIFVRNTTVLDCAVWDPRCGPRGQSWQVDVEWIGSTDSEGVVLDFSHAKKMAKNQIDQLFDHRLLISELFVESSDGRRVICHPPAQLPTSERFLIETYPDSLAILPDEAIRALSLGDTRPLEELISVEIKKVSAHNVSAIKVKLKAHESSAQNHHFNYLHSLRLHSGNCQRFHGHSNVVELFENGQPNLVAAAEIACKLNGKYLVAEDYLCKELSRASGRFHELLDSLGLTDLTHTKVEYQGTQGLVTVCVPSHRLILMPDESTIENISRWIFERLCQQMPNVEVYGYEGLQKGAIYP